MKKIYRTDIGTKISFLLFGLPILVFTFYWLFISKDASLFKKIISGIGFIMSVWVIPALLSFKLTLDDEYISAENIIRIPPLTKFKWNEISKLTADAFLFEEDALITISSKDKAKQRKAILIPIGFGLPYEVLKDILPRLPKDATVKIEPFLMKYIQGEPKVYTKRKLSLIVILLILMVIGGFLLSWFLAFHNPWMK